MSALFWNFKLQELCQEVSDHHGSLTIFDWHSMHYPFVYVDFKLSFFELRAFTRSEPVGLRFNGLYFKSYQELTRPCNIDFLIADAT